MSAETIRSFPGFAILDATRQVYARTSATPRRLPDFSTRRDGETTHHDIAVGARSSGPLDVQREADRLVLAEYAPPGVVITDDLVVLQFRGRTGPFLEPAPGVASLDLLRMVRDELRLPLRQAIDEARTTLVATRRVTPVSDPAAIEGYGSFWGWWQELEERALGPRLVRQQELLKKLCSCTRS